MVKPEVECPDVDMNNTAFVRATTTIGGRDAVEEFVACKMYPLASSFSFREVTIDTTHVSKVWTPLPLFPVEAVSVENSSHVLAEVEIEVERIIGSFGPKEYDAFTKAKLPNGDCLNHVFENMGLAYAPCLLPGTEAFHAVAPHVSN
jgi:hypothetical protein